MKYPTMRFVFDRKKVATKTHKGLVQIEVLSEGKRKWIGTGVKVYSDQWNDRKKIINSVEMIQLNQCLDEQLRIIQNWINELISKKEVFDFSSFLSSEAASSPGVLFSSSGRSSPSGVRFSTHIRHLSI